MDKNNFLLHTKRNSCVSCSFSSLERRTSRCMLAGFLASSLAPSLPSCLPPPSCRQRRQSHEAALRAYPKSLGAQEAASNAFELCRMITHTKRDRRLHYTHNVLPKRPLIRPKNTRCRLLEIRSNYFTRVVIQFLP